MLTKQISWKLTQSWPGTLTQIQLFDTIDFKWHVYIVNKIVSGSSCETLERQNMQKFGVLYKILIQCRSKRKIDKRDKKTKA